MRGKKKEKPVSKGGEKTAQKRRRKVDKKKSSHDTGTLWECQQKKKDLPKKKTHENCWKGGIMGKKKTLDGKSTIKETVLLPGKVRNLKPTEFYKHKKKKFQ